ncbi:MAG TPA: hypothetical protein VHC69_00745 [Polyangiaceae bacterium]|nr:hypothetical protein [Polyangiaceae bacterium]
MNPIAAATGFQLTPSGRFEARRLAAPDTAQKLVIAKDTAEQKLTVGASAAPKLVIGTPSAKPGTPSAKLATPSAKPATPTASTPDGATPIAAPAAQGAPNQKVDPKLEKVAHEFEAIFLRNLLKPMEEAGSMGKQASVSSGSSVYGSMMVGALADSASQGGGIGLAHVVLEALTRGAAAQKPSE